MRWPVRETLELYVNKREGEALEQYRFDCLIYMIGGGKKPVVPEELRGRLGNT